MNILNPRTIKLSTKDFVDVMLEIMGSQQTDYQIDRPTIKAIMLVSKHYFVGKQSLNGNKFFYICS